MNLTVMIVGAIAIFFLIGLAAHFQVTRSLTKWLDEVQNLAFDRTSRNPPSPWLGVVIEEYRNHRVNQIPVNTQALIEKHLMQQRVVLAGIFPAPIGNVAKMIGFIPSFTIILGVLGTFIGLTQSLFAMQHTLLSLGNGQENGPLSFDAVLAAISSPFQGMSTAFITSIAGIGTAFLLNFLQSGFLSGGRSVSYLTNKLFSECETLLEHVYEAKIALEQPNDTYERILERLANRIRDSFQETIGDFSQNMIHFTEKLDETVAKVHTLIGQLQTHAEAFSQSAEKLKLVSVSFDKTAMRFAEANKSSENQVQALKAAVERAFQRAESHEQRLEQAAKQTLSFIERSDKKSEELSRQFLRAMEAQMEGFHEKYDLAANHLQRQQEDFIYKQQEMTNQYAQTAEAFSESIDQLERSLYQMFEKTKRDILDHIKYQNDRKAQWLNQDDRRQELRDLSRSFETLSHNMERQWADNQRYIQDFYQLLNRISYLIEQQTAYQQQKMSRPLPTRVIDS
jgi:hypothetical protein